MGQKSMTWGEFQQYIANQKETKTLQKLQDWWDSRKPNTQWCGFSLSQSLRGRFTPETIMAKVTEAGNEDVGGIMFSTHLGLGYVQVNLSKIYSYTEDGEERKLIDEDLGNTLELIGIRVFVDNTATDLEVARFVALG